MNNEAAAIGGLAAHGAQNLLVLNVPDLGKTPMKSPTDPAVTAEPHRRVASAIKVNRERRKVDASRHREFPGDREGAITIALLKQLGAARESRASFMWHPNQRPGSETTQMCHGKPGNPRLP